MNVSVIIPAYNAAATIAHTIESLLAQTCPHWEAIIVDDGSTDATCELAQTHAARDGRIRVVTQPNGGESAARNTGIGHARHDWLLFLDADDFIAPQYLARMSTALAEQPDLQAIHCGSVRVTADGIQLSDDYEVPEGDLFPILARRAAFPVHACMVRKRLVEQAGSFDVSLQTSPDWDLWQRIARTGIYFGAVREVLAYYRITPNSSSQDAGQLLRDGLTVLKRGHSADSRVRDPHPDYRNGLSGHRVEDQVFYLLSWCAGLMLGMGRDARALLDQVAEYRHSQLNAEAIARCIYEAGTLPCSRPREFWEELFPRVATQTEAFLNALESQSQSAGMARAALRHLKVRILRRSKLWGSAIEDMEAERGELMNRVERLTKPQQIGNWQLAVGQHSAATMSMLPDDSRGIRVTISKVSGAALWEVQINYSGVRVQAHERVALGFRARSDQRRVIGAGVARASEPWTNLGFYREFRLDTSWRTFREEFVLPDGNDDARLHFDMGDRTGVVEFHGLTFGRVMPGAARA